MSYSYTKGHTGYIGGREMGSGLASARNCMPGNHAVMQQRGGRVLPWRGAKVWHCAACAAKRTGDVA